MPFIPYPTPLHGANGNLLGAINMLVDISERKDAENRQKALIDELNHRVKNTLATVQSLAGQTARHADSLGEFLPTFETRIMALARAHDLLTKRHWQDAPLGCLVREIIAPMVSYASHRIQIEGPSIELSPRAALSMTMALNELATNAVKYGALSAESGALSIRWMYHRDPAQPHLALEWKEQGGPSVKAPTRRGFGTRMIERCIERDLDGEVDLEFQADGVRCNMTIAIARLERSE